MKTIKIKLYSFNELSEKAKQKAIEQCRPDEVFWADENRDTLEKFAEIFPVKITRWEYGGRGEGVNYHFTSDDCIEELTGQRLATYLWNNYRTQIFKGRYYGHLSGKTKDGKRIAKSKQHPIGKRHVRRYPKIMLEHSCVLTGYCMDDNILAPIYKFLEIPTDDTFKDLLDACFDAWVKGCNDDIEYQNSDEVISENITANEYTFEADGTMRNA